jgi:hypothetical protein
MKISVPFSTTVSTFLADMIDFPCFHGRETRTSRLRPCPSARPGVASATATRAEGDRPPFRAAQGAGLHKRVPSFGEEDRRKSAEDAGRPLGSAPVLAGALARARGGAPSVSFMRKRSIGPVPAKPPGGATKKSSRRAVRRDAGPSASREGYVIAREGSKPLAETLRGSVHESPVRRLPHARKKISARKLYPRERHRSSRSTLSRGHFCADRCWNSWHGDAKAIAAIRKAILAPAKLTTFQRVNTSQTNARPVNLQRVAVDDARLACHVIRARGATGGYNHQRRDQPDTRSRSMRSGVGHTALQDTSTRHLPPS